MKLNERQLDLKRGLTQEWIITNGIGGFSSQTVLGINTRKYHGLLVAPLLPPARRFVILSKIDESITFEDGTEEIIYSNMCKNYISEGYKNLKSFEKVYTPKFTYKVNGVVIEKSIAMIHGKNIVTIFYKVNSDKDITIKLAPVMNFRDFHQMSSGAEFDVSQRIDKENKISHRRLRLILFSLLYVFALTIFFLIQQQIIGWIASLGFVQWFASKLSVSERFAYCTHLFAAITVNLIIGVFYRIAQHFVLIGLKKKNLAEPAKKNGEFTLLQRIERRVLTFFNREFFSLSAVS